MNDSHGSYHSERRIEQRRKLEDRRQSIRFEPLKEERRKGRGRRIADGDIWHHHEE